MLKNKTKMFLLFSLVLITMIGMTAISAADTTNNDTVVTTASSDASNQVVDTITSVDTSDNSNKQITTNTKTNDKNIKGDGESGSLTDFESDINSAEDSIILTKDYTSTSSEQPFVLAKNITIDGNGKTITAVNGAFNITSGSTVTIKNLIFTGKNATPAMITLSGTLNLENVTFTDCFSTNYQYPAVLEVNAYSVLTMNQCSINNTCSTTAPIRMYGYSNVNITNTNITNVISRNSIIYIAANYANLSIDNSILANAKDSNYGGAINNNYAYSTVTVNNTIIENNTAGYRGGAIYSKGNVTLTNSIIRNNTLTSDSYNRPEGVWMDSTNGYLTVSNNTFSNNNVGYDEAYYFNNGYMNSPVKITVANYTFEEDETVVLIAFVTDADGNKIGDCAGTLTFTVDDQTFTSSTIENGTAYVVATGLEVDNSYRVSASYSKLSADLQEVTEGVVEYGNVLPPMTDYNSMQEVIDSQNESAVIKLNNNITRADSEVKVIIDKDLTINGKGLTINADEGQIFEITDGATVTISNVILTNAKEVNIINITNGNLILDNVTFTNSTATDKYLQSAAISVKQDSTLVVNNSQFDNMYGIIIDALGQSTIIDNTTITNSNTGSVTGGLIMAKSNVTILNSDISDNTGYSAIIYSAASLPAFRMNGTLTIDNSTFKNNTITMGSAVINAANTTNINNSRFIANTATRSSAYASALNIAGIAANPVTMTVTNSVFENNTSAGEEGSTVFVGSYSTFNATNSIFLRNDTNPFLGYSTSSAKAILNNNYWGSNENPIKSEAVLTSKEVYDDYYDEWETENYDVTLNNWVIFDATVTEDAEDNFLFNVETGFTKTNSTDGTISDLEGTIPDYFNVIFDTTAGSFDYAEVTTVNGVANNVYHAGLSDAELTISTVDVTKTFNITAPEIIPNNYRGLQILLDATASGETVDLTMNVKRGSEENNVTISNKTLVIDGNGYTINENDGRFLLIQNANVTLKNMIIKNAGTSYNPSVLQIWTGNLVLENVTIIDSASGSSSGALVYIGTDSTATINNVTWDNNTARFISNGGSTVINNSVIKNTQITTSSQADWGYSNGPLTIENTVFDNNTGYSAGITTGSSSNAYIILDNVTFTNNQVTNAGTNAILLTSSSVLNMTNVRAENNSATGTGAIGGLFHVKGNTIVDNSTFINNHVNSSTTSSWTAVVGVFYVNGGSTTKLNITQSTFINNTGATRGNVIYNYYGSFNISNSVLIGNGNETNSIALYNFDAASYANNNWWGTNDSPSQYVTGNSARYTIANDTWVIMDAAAGDVEDGKTVITTTLNKVTDADGTISDLEGSLPDGLEVTYDVTTGSLLDSTTLTNGVSTATVQTANDKYTVTVTQGYESIELSNDIFEGDIIVTNDSYSQFFNDDGTAKSIITADRIVYISGVLTDKDFIFNVPVNVTTYTDQATINNGRFEFQSNAKGSNMTGIIINNTDYTAVAVFIDGAANMNISNVTITQTNTDGTTVGIAFNKTSGTTIEDNNITITGKSYAINNDYQLSQTAAIQGYNSSNNYILNNDINMQSTGNGGSSYALDSIIGIEVRGEYYIDYSTWKTVNDASENNMVSDNRITLTGDAKYMYGIRFGNQISESIINNNTIDVTSPVYAAGVEMGVGEDYQVLYNNITLTATNYTYGVIISTNNMGAISGATVYQNNIILAANDNYGVQLYGSDENTVSENVITALGNYSMGIAGYNSDENFITDNNITVTGDSSQTKQATSDNVGQYISGILLLARSSATDNSVTGNIITVVDLSGADAYAVTIKGNDNTVTDNTLYGTNLKGDNAVNSTGTNTVEDNYPIGDIKITNDTYSQYFDEYGMARSIITADSTVYLSGEFTDKNFVFNIPVTVTTDEEQAILNNSIITFTTGADGSTISDIIINNKDYSENVIVIFGVDDITVENMTITQINEQINTTHAFNIQYSDDVTIRNNTITTIGQSLGVDYDENYQGTPFTSSIYALASDNLVIDSNIINTNQTGTAASFGTIEGIDVQGVRGDEDEDIDDILVENLQITNNEINTQSSVYTYGIVLNNMVYNALVDNNTINSYSDYYSNGIEAFNTSYTNITNNKISVFSDEFAYAIFLSGMMDYTTYDVHTTDNNIIKDNQLTAVSSVAYVIELYMADHNTIEYNNLTSSGNYSIGIAGSDSGYSTISYNNIILNNNMQASQTPTYDSIESYPTGIKFVFGYMAQPGYNTITYNNITVNAETTDDIYTVNLTTTDGNTVTDNTLYGVGLNGSSSVYSTGDDNTIERNSPMTVTSIVMEDVDGIIGATVTVTVNVAYEDGSNVQEGTVTFKDVNGKEIGTSEVTNGTASIDLTYNKVTDTVIYAEYEDLQANATVTIRKSNTTITINQFDATINKTVNISATVTDENGNAVTSGKVVFKVNGKTLKDENGKVIYAQVIDGVATIEYTIPDTWAGKNISISAVYSGSTIYESARNEGVEINVTMQSEDDPEEIVNITPSIKIAELPEEVSSGTTMEVTVEVTGTPSPLNSGKVVLKLNGKTLKDDDGKVIYASVVDGKVTFNVTFSTTKTKDFTVKAVFIHTDYERIEDTTTITVNK